MILIIGVKFRKSGKVYYFDPGTLNITKGDHVIVETARGIEYGSVVLGPKEVTDDKVIQPLKPVIRIATEEDEAVNEDNQIKEKEAFDICFDKIKKHDLDMKLIDSEYTFDKNKLLFYFTADGRIDFRELVKDLASIFRTRIELRQIGVRDETKIIGGIAICGRPLCCHTYLSDFAPVSIKMAKEQNLSLNPTKISGVCGRLMCCLKNEEEAYEYLNSTLPHINAEVKTADGYEGVVQSVSVLKQRVKVIITKDNDEKDVREYHVDELSFEKKKDAHSAPIAVPLPDEDIDENALKELEQMEKNDIEELAEEEAADNNVVKKSFNKNNNRNNPSGRQSKNNYSQHDKHFSKDYKNNKDNNSTKDTRQNKDNKNQRSSYNNRPYKGHNARRNNGQRSSSGGYTNQSN